MSLQILILILLLFGLIMLLFLLLLLRKRSALVMIMASMISCCVVLCCDGNMILADLWIVFCSSEFCYCCISLLLILILILIMVLYDAWCHYSLSTLLSLGGMPACHAIYLSAETWCKYWFYVNVRCDGTKPVIFWQLAGGDRVECSWVRCRDVVRAHSFRMDMYVHGH